jgi:hypothetical protein
MASTSPAMSEANETIRISIRAIVAGIALRTKKKRRNCGAVNHICFDAEV